MKIACPLTAPVDLSASFCLYHSLEVKRIAILGTMPVRTAPSPLYKASGVSFFMMSFPVARKPRRFALCLIRW